MWFICIAYIVTYTNLNVFNLTIWILGQIGEIIIYFGIFYLLFFSIHIIIDLLRLTM